MPVQPDEVMSKIWMRGRTRLNKELEIAFETNKNNVTIFGAQPTESLPGKAWNLLAESDGCPGPFFFSQSPHGIDRLVFESYPQPSSIPPYLRLHNPTTDCPYSIRLESFFWSSEYQRQGPGDISPPSKRKRALSPSFRGQNIQDQPPNNNT
jgi:hypothetical protein